MSRILPHVPNIIAYKLLFLSRNGGRTRIQIQMARDKLERTLVTETTKQIGKEVLLKGWINSIRDHGKITFVDLKDRSGVIQCVGEKLQKVSPESVVEIIGEVVERSKELVNPKLETGTVELPASKLVILNTLRTYLVILLKDVVYSALYLAVTPSLEALEPFKQSV